MPDILQFFIFIIPLLFAVTLHEVAHGYAALKFGDHTAQFAGRLTLNPITHLDPFGSVILPAILIFSGSPAIFGYAKPVPVDFRNLRNPKLGTIVVSVAGVATNLVSAAIGGLVYRAFIIASRSMDLTALTPLIQMVYAFTVISVVLAIFNLIPIPPLDGSRILSALLPPRARARYERIGPFGIILLLVLLMTNALSFLMIYLIAPLVRFFIGG